MPYPLVLEIADRITEEDYRNEAFQQIAVRDDVLDPQEIANRITDEDLKTST